jgi:acyl-CoA synthetase (AMP-forming)/AMP-acid ligase II
MTALPFPTRREHHYGGRLITCFANRPAGIDAMFRDAVRRAPDRCALVCGEQRLAYRELESQVEALAANLARRGFSKGDRLALLAGNRPEFLVAVLAAVRAGLIIVPIGIRQRRPEIEFVLKQCGAAGLIYDAELAGNLPRRGSLPELRELFVIGDGNGDGTPFASLLEGHAQERATWPASGEEDVFCLLYTSGTTGQPKGAKLTHLGAIHSVMNYEQAMALRDGEVSVLAVPASHVTGLVAILLTMIRVCGCTVMMPAFKARDFLALAARERMTHALLVPAMYNLCLLEPDFSSYDLKSWRVGGFGGAPMPQATIARLAAALPALVLQNAYGATETTSPVTLLPPGEAAGRSDTVGKAVACAELRVMDEDGHELPPGMPGELWMAGPMVIPGYWSNPEADAAGFDGGWWKSGDIGSIDGEGYVRIHDRKKDMINRGGYKVYSIEVENVLARHPGVVECAVIPVPDDVLGERVHALVVPRGPAPDAAELKAFCAQSLADYKVPEIVTFMDEPLPRNANGKVLKTVLRERGLER